MLYSKITSVTFGTPPSLIHTREVTYRILVTDEMMGNQCSFELDPDSFETDLQFTVNEANEKGNWSCSYECQDESEYCILHQPVDEKDPELLQRWVHTHIHNSKNDSADPESDVSSALIGIRAERLEFNSQVLGAIGEIIDMRGAQLGELILKGSIVNGGLNLRGCTIKGSARFDQSTFDAGVELVGAKIGTLSADGAQFRDRLLVKGVNITSDLLFEQITVEGVINGNEIAIDGKTVLRNADFHDISTFSDSEFGKSVLARNVTFRRRVDFSSSWFENDVNFKNTTFEAELLLSRALISGIADFSDAVFEKQFTLNEVTFRKVVKFNTATFHKGVSMQAIAFENDISFAESAFEGPALFTGTHFRGDVDYSSAIFKKQTDFQNTIFGNEATFDGVIFDDRVSFIRTHFETLASFRGAKIEAVADFSDAQFRGETDFEGATVRGEFDFSLSGDEDQQHQIINLQGVTIENGVLPLPEQGNVIYDLEEATLGDALIATGEIDRPLEHYRLVNVTYDGFDFSRGNHREAFEASDWNIHRTVTEDTDSNKWGIWKLPRRFGIFLAGHEDTNPNTLESTYIKAKNGANQIGDSIAASKFFQREKLFRRWGHRSKLTDSESSTGERFKGAFGWSTNLGFSIVSGYGERPLRVVGSSLAFIFVFALIYQFVTTGLFDQGGFGMHLLFSFQSFITFIVGTPPGATTFTVQLLSSLQGFFGAFLIALFVFTLTRSVDR